MNKNEQRFTFSTYALFATEHVSYKGNLDAMYMFGFLTPRHIGVTYVFGTPLNNPPNQEEIGRAHV